MNDEFKITETDNYLVKFSQNDLQLLQAGMVRVMQETNFHSLRKAAERMYERLQAIEFEVE